MQEPEVSGAPRVQHRSCPSSPYDDGAGDPPHAGGELVDSALLEEIMLLSEVITTVALYPGHLDDGQVDDVLGVEEPRSRVRTRRPRAEPA